MPRARLKERTMCHYCLTRPGITTDHVVPRAFGGPDARWNYVSSCEPCNLDKGATWPTCPCAFCRTAIHRFLSEPARKEKALRRLEAQSAEMTSGIQAMEDRRDKLILLRSSLDELYDRIEGYDPVDMAPYVEILEKKF